jgi:hypothetical protein
MVSWLVALLAGAAAAWLGYPGRSGGWLRVAAGARGLAVAALVAAWLDAPAGRAGRTSPTVALDVSQSMRRGGDALWRAALDSARAIGGVRAVLVGDTVRLGDVEPGAGADQVGLALPLLAEAALRDGAPLTFITDGELPPGAPSLLDQLPAGSRVLVLPRPPFRDLAIESVSVEDPVLAGDSARLTVRLRSGAEPLPASTLEVVAPNAGTALQLALPPMAPGEARTERLVLPVGPDATRLDLRVVGTVANDREPRNDSVRVSVAISDQPRAVVVATAPDPDVRFALEAWRGAIGEGTRAYLRIAPGQWRDAATLAPIAEAVVRARARAARTLVVQGDTTWLGPLADVAAGGVLLVVPPPLPAAPARADALPAREEWFVAGAPASPVSAALAGIAWDSLPPLSAGPGLAGARPDEGVVLQALLGRRGSPRPIVRWATTSGRRTIVVSARGFAAWAVRPGGARDAHDALWGGLASWVGEAPPRRAALRPLAAVQRTGMPIDWALPGTQRPAQLVARPVEAADDSARQRRLPLRYDRVAGTAQSDGLPVGRWRIWSERVAGAAAAELDVNPSGEWLPRAPTVSGRVTAPRGATVPREGLARFGWPLVLIVSALSVEWLARRQGGLR